MSPVLEQTPASKDVAAARDALRFGWREQLVEVLVFLFLIVPSMALALLLVHQAPEKIGFPLMAVSIMLRDLGLAALIFFFLWRNGEPTSRIGWRSRRAWREVAIGVLLYVPFSAAMFGLERLFLQLGLSQPSPSSEAFLRPHGAGQLVLAGVLVVVVAITEETIFRGYLLLRFSALSRSMVFAVILSSLIFSIGHGYEGSAGVATVGVMGAIFAVIYLWRGSLVAPVTMHFLQDFIAIVVLSALAREPANTALTEVPHNGTAVLDRLEVSNRLEQPPVTESSFPVFRHLRQPGNREVVADCRFAVGGEALRGDDGVSTLGVWDQRTDLIVEKQMSLRMTYCAPSSCVAGGRSLALQLDQYAVPRQQPVPVLLVQRQQPSVLG